MGNTSGQSHVQSNLSAFYSAFQTEHDRLEWLTCWISLCLELCTRFFFKEVGEGHILTTTLASVLYTGSSVEFIGFIIRIEIEMMKTSDSNERFCLMGQSHVQSNLSAFYSAFQTNFHPIHCTTNKKTLPVSPAFGCAPPSQLRLRVVPTRRLDRVGDRKYSLPTRG